MFLNFFRKTDNSDENFVYDQGVIVDISLDGFEEFGTGEQHKEIEHLQREIAKLLPVGSGIDGDEFGDGACTIYIYGPSADTIFSAIEPQLKKSAFNHIEITLQYTDPADKNINDKKFTL